MVQSPALSFSMKIGMYDDFTSENQFYVYKIERVILAAQEKTGP